MRKWGHGSESEKKRNMCCSRYSVALDTLYTLPPPAIAVVIPNFAPPPPPPSKPCRRITRCATSCHSSAHPFHCTHSASPHAVRWCGFVRVENVEENIQSKHTIYSIYIFNPNERTTTTTSRRRQQQHRKVKSMAAQYVQNSNVCRSVLFHPLRVYTRVSVFTQNIVYHVEMLWGWVWYGIWYMVRRWSFATQLTDCCITAYFALCFLLDYMACDGLCTANVHISRRRGYIQPEVAIDRCIVRFREKWELCCSYTCCLVRALLLVFFFGLILWCEVNHHRFVCVGWAAGRLHSTCIYPEWLV